MTSRTLDPDIPPDLNAETPMPTLAESGGITQERQNKIEQVQTHAIGNGTPKHI